MKRGDGERLDDLAEAIAAIHAHLESRAPSELKRDAVLYNLVIVGEAVKGLSHETRARHPKIPWKQIAGLRDLLTHEYFRIDMDEIDMVVERDLLPLAAAVQALRRKPSPRRRSV